MEQSQRWFGPEDSMTLQHLRQAGATGAVSALRLINRDRAWSGGEVRRRWQATKDAGLRQAAALPARDRAG